MSSTTPPIIAQYGQWDGYPSGQGATVLEFCRGHLKTQKGRAAFKEKLARCRWATPTEVSDFLKSIGCENGWLNTEQASKYNAAFPYMSRDHGGKILSMVNESGADAQVVLTDSYEFSRDSLFCEYAYVVDLTRETLEAYFGYQNDPLPMGERFSGIAPNDRGYYPVRLAGSWSLSKPPTQRTFERVIDQTITRCRPSK